MPLLFLHGVNTRDTDPDYKTSAAARTKMFEDLVAAPLRAKGHPEFQVKPDIYWGNLGVQFAWNLASVPIPKGTDKLGPATGGAAMNLDLLRAMSDTSSAAPAGTTEKLGPAAGGPLVIAAQQDPGGLVRAVFSTEAEQFSPTTPRAGARAGAPITDEQAARRGEQLGLMFRAVDDFAKAAAQNPALVAAATDDAVLQKIAAGVSQQYQALVEASLAGTPSPASDKESLGTVQDSLAQAVNWTRQHIQDVANGAKAVVNGVKSAAQGAVNSVERQSTLLLLEQTRASVSNKAFRFLGDVFVYLQHGKTADPSIYGMVRKGIEEAAPKKVNGKNSEPFIMVTHSFGSEIFYDLLTSGDLDGIYVDLWASAGAQTSLFAEMRLYGKSPLDVPSEKTKYLGRPANVGKWINFYDQADILSYLHRPVFGDDVEDIPVSEGANLTNAHGHYFLVPAFYERIAAAL